MRAALVATAGFAALWITTGTAHPGGLNSEGCHNNRKTGDYHCHRSPAPTAARAPTPGAFLAPSGGRGQAGRVFANCSEARAAGAAPVRRRQPGYGPHLDRDNDGIGCE
jgi:hypothetical protein